MTSSATSRRSFLGIPVEGDVPPRQPRPVQRPLSDLEPVLRAILATNEIVSRLVRLDPVHAVFQRR